MCRLYHNNTAFSLPQRASKWAIEKQNPSRNGTVINQTTKIVMESVDKVFLSVWLARKANFWLWIFPLYLGKLTQLCYVRKSGFLNPLTSGYLRNPVSYKLTICPMPKRNYGDTVGLCSQERRQFRASNSTFLNWYCVMVPWQEIIDYATHLTCDQEAVIYCITPSYT